MRSKKRDTNIKILEAAMRDVAVSVDKVSSLLPNPAKLEHAPIAATTEVKPTETLKKGRGVKKDALINTKRLLCL